MAKNNKNEIKTNNNQLEQTQKTKDEKEGFDLKLRVIFVFFQTLSQIIFACPCSRFSFPSPTLQIVPHNAN